MPATTLAEMIAGRNVLRKGKDNILVIIKGIDKYLIRDLRPNAVNGNEVPSGSLPPTTYHQARTDWILYDYDTTRTTFNTDMADLSA